MQAVQDSTHVAAITAKKVHVTEELKLSRSRHVQGATTDAFQSSFRRALFCAATASKCSSAAKRQRDLTSSVSLMQRDLRNLNRDLVQHIFLSTPSILNFEVLGVAAASLASVESDVSLQNPLAVGALYRAAFIFQCSFNQ